MKKNNGFFVISLDFELMWGVRDVVTKETYGEHISGVHSALPKILKIFSEYEIKATFAVVGLLFCKNKGEILHHLPRRLPSYKGKTLSPFGQYMETIVGENEQTDPYHFAWSVIKQIQHTPGQEIGTHTFSHYYCLENGQTLADFEDDLHSAIAVANNIDIQLTSIIFPRNQVNNEYLKTCEQMGFVVYRSNEASWIYQARNLSDETLLRRAFRLLDAYVNISGHHCYTKEYMISGTMVNIPSSRFLRPYSKKLQILEAIRLKRIKGSMTHAAKNNLTYHLWWHPHNFGINQDENLLFLKHILEHYVQLHKKYGFESITMTGLANKFLKQ